VEAIEEIATGNEDVRLRPAFEGHLSSVSAAMAAASTVLASPDDRLETALEELRSTTARELLEALGRVSPKFFEAILLDVLHKIGYGMSRSDLARVGRSGDGGIDGIISLDRLGLEKIYVQGFPIRRAPEPDPAVVPTRGQHRAVGIEDVEDLIADLESAFAAIV
jgi:restriction system protein